MSTRRSEAEALIRSIQRHSETRVRELLERADRAAAAATAAARKTARQRVRRVIRSQRERLEDRVIEARSQFALRAAHRRQEQQLETLRALHPGLRRMLQSLWAEEPAREAWVAHAIERAAASLTDRAWRIEHPPDWKPTAAARAAVDAADATAAWKPLSGIDAGLRIGTAAATVDATAAGLLARPARIDGLLLARLEEESDHGD